MATPLIKIGTQPKAKSGRSTKLFRYLSGTVADKFFLLGSLAVVIGAPWFGVHLWLLRNGQIAAKPLHDIYRELHGIVQIYLFFGAFACGFLLQAGPKLFASSFSPAKGGLGILLLNILAAICLGVDPSSFLGRSLLSASYLGLALLIAITAWHGSPKFRVGLALPIVFGTLSLAGGIFLELRNPLNSLLLFWSGVLPIVLGAAQQFIGGTLGGRKLSNQEGVSVWGLWAISAALLFQYNTSSQPWLWNGFAILGTLAIILYSVKVKLISSIISDRTATLNQTLLCGSFWLVCGIIALPLGPAYSDAALHLWGTGLIVPLIIAVSMRIVGFLSGKEVMSDRLYLWLLTTWQLVPFGRGLGPFLGLPGWFSWIVGLASSGLICVWFYLLVKGIWRIAKYQLGLPSEKDPISC